jgi:hypothetical protein
MKGMFRILGFGDEGDINEGVTYAEAYCGHNERVRRSSRRQQTYLVYASEFHGFD